jgi:hypothetical protein
MNNEPSFVDFAAIQIFAAMVNKDNPGRVGIADAGHAWELAKMLHDAKPKDAPNDDDANQPTVSFEFVIDQDGTYGVYRDGVFVLEECPDVMDRGSAEYLRRTLGIPDGTAIICCYRYIRLVVPRGEWPKLLLDATRLCYEPT